MRLGVVGSLVWDEIHGRDPAAPPIEEWGGIAYALAGFEAALPTGWEVVPLIKVGRDLSREAAALLRTFTRITPGGRFVEVPDRNNRVVLHYRSSERRCEQMSGGVPGWTWTELGPMVRDLDALYLNFISGFEMTLETATALRQGFLKPVYADLHSLFFGIRTDGERFLQSLPEAPSWFRCFDLVQVNEDEMLVLSEDPMTAPTTALAAGVGVFLVTLGARGAVYFSSPAAADGLDPVAARWRGDPSSGGIRTARVPAPAVDALDPTGCGDVFGATCFARLLAGEPVEEAIRQANHAAARTATFHGASGLAAHLRGQLVRT